MPLTQKNNFVSVTVKEPVIDLRKGSDKIALSSAIDATVMGGKTASGTIDVAGNIEYNKDDGAFYLQNIEVLNFKSDKISDAYKDIVKVLAQQVLNTALKTHPIYKLDTSKTQDKLVKATLKSVKIKDEKLLLKMGLF